jgi:hypothetical protein
MEGKRMKIPSPGPSLEAWEEVDDLKAPVKIHPTDRISL